MNLMTAKGKTALDLYACLYQ